MTSEKLQTLLKFKAPKYKGIETDLYENNFVSEFNLYRSICADMILEGKYIIWINEKELYKAMMAGTITMSEIAQDLGFAIAYTSKIEGAKAADALYKELYKTYSVTVASVPQKNPFINHKFAELIAHNFKHAVDVYA